MHECVCVCTLECTSLHSERDNNLVLLEMDAEWWNRKPRLLHVHTPLPLNSRFLLHTCNLCLLLNGLSDSVILSSKRPRKPNLVFDYSLIIY